MVVTKVQSLNVNDVYPLVLESEQEGFRFVRRFYDEYSNGENRFDRAGEALFVAYESNQVVGICGLNRDPYITFGKVGRVRRLYVHPNHRTYGVGRQLVSHVVAEATRYYEVLTLRTDNPVADKFYKAIGFSTDATFEHATHLLSLTSDV
jgi:ribosomal protein S18 acetylase RimI-like enzyme